MIKSKDEIMELFRSAIKEVNKADCITPIFLT